MRRAFSPRESSAGEGRRRRLLHSAGGRDPLAAILRIAVRGGLLAVVAMLAGWIGWSTYLGQDRSAGTAGLLPHPHDNPEQAAPGERTNLQRAANENSGGPRRGDAARGTTSVDSREDPPTDQHSGRDNRLAGESSPYLLLHKTNPVDWFPWGPEALEKARRENKPIFLSVGYSTCYWCHVMERESFSDPAIAAAMNRHFVNVKVDREERPDLDDIYMTATQILTGHGGWPNSVFLTPDLKPFYAGTYFPPDDRQGRPGFKTLVEHLAEAWRDRRQDVQAHADEVAASMRRFLEERFEPAAAPPAPTVAERSLEGLAARFDGEWGGFGAAPKFPTPSNLYLLLEMAGDRPASGSMLTATLDQMARGGIYDQLAGGFHRYSTDREWKVPHFEKMLYDNGFLLEIYAREHARSGDPQAARVVRETAAFLAREMTSPEGALYSAIDAETDAREGAFYVWSRKELERVLGEEDFQFLAPLYGFDGPAFFEAKEYVLHLPRPLHEAAESRRTSRKELLAEIEPLRAKLLAARGERERPLTDDKILTDWNGIAITGLAEAGRLLEEPELVTQAERAADFLLAHLRPEDGPLLHTWRAGEAKLPAFLGDYVFFVRGLLALHRATGEERWLEAAIELTDEQLRRLGSPDGGFYSAEESADLLIRTRDVFDGAMPAANAVAALNLLALAERTEGDTAQRFRDQARSTLQAFGGLVEGYPEGLRMLALAAHRLGEEAGGGTARAAKDPAGSDTGVAGLDREAREVVAVAARFADRGEGGEGEGEDGDRAWLPFTVTLAIGDGWHVNANPASDDFLIATVVEGRGTAVRGVSYPEPRTLRPEYADGEIAVFEGEVVVRGEVRAPEGEATVAVTYQPCDAERCLRAVTVELPVTPAE